MNGQIVFKVHAVPACDGCKQRHVRIALLVSSKRIAYRDLDFAGARVRAPDVVAVVAAYRLRQPPTLAKEIDRAGLPVI